MGATNYSDILKQNRKKFFLDSPIVNPDDEMAPDFTTLSEKIELKVSINQIRNDCSYQIKIFYLINNEKKLLNKIIDCESNDQTAYLNTPLFIRYFFEKEQHLIFEIKRIDSNNSKNEMISTIKTTLGCIMGSRKNTLEKKIFQSENELLILKIEKLKKNEDAINIKFKIEPQKNISFKEIKYKMYFEIYSDSKILYRSECINNEGKFLPIRIPVILFPNDNIHIKLYKSNRHIRIDSTLKIPKSTNRIKKFKQRINGTEFHIISTIEKTKMYTFVDYIKAGVQIGLSVAIDFTGSNGPPNDINSLHYISKARNQYERAILSCGNIVGKYDYDQLFPCFGFGAKINNRPFQLFNLNFNRDDPNIKHIQGIINSYHNAIKKIDLFGPTNFSPIIEEIIKMIEDENSDKKYHILMILTDGEIDDMDDTIDKLVKGSSKPLSVIIIGVGNANFKSMIKLDADEKPLINSEGEMAARDLVQFVPFLEYESNNVRLANQVLEEIPRQFVEYYEIKSLVTNNLA